MPRGIFKNGVNKGWFKKGHKLGLGKKRGALTKEWKQKISQAMKGKKPSEKCLINSLIKRKGKPLHQIRGWKNGNWRGIKTGYNQKHIWIRSIKGTPTKCEHCGKTDKSKYHWANIDHKYSRNLDDYIGLCVSCHRKYDYGFNKKITKVCGYVGSIQPRASLLQQRENSFEARPH